MWHQYFRLRFFAPAHYLIHNRLGLRKGTLTARLGILFTVFLVSGFLHFVSDVSQGIYWRDSGAVGYFCMQPWGILLESVVQEIYRRVAKNGGKALLNKRSERTIGYLWVVAWLIWTVPAYTYPGYRITTGGNYDRLLPFTLLGNIL